MPRNPIQDSQYGQAAADQRQFDMNRERIFGWRGQWARPYPNPRAYSNAFQQAGNNAALIREFRAGYPNQHLARDARRNLDGRVKGYEGRGRRRRKTTKRVGHGRRRAAPRRRKPVRKGSGRRRTAVRRRRR